MLLLKIEYSVLIGHLCTSTTVHVHLNYWSHMVRPYIFQSHFLMLYPMLIQGFFFLVALKWGKWATFFICVSLFLRFKIFHIPSNTGYNFCALNILRYKNDSKKKVKIRSSWKLPGINGISSEWLSK